MVLLPVLFTLILLLNHLISDVVVQSLSCVQLCDPMDCSTSGFPVLCHLLGVCSNSYPLNQWCYPNISSSVTPFSCPQSFPASGCFPELAVCIGWWKYWSLSFSISPSNEYSRLISFMIDWFDLAVYGTDSQESSPTPQFESISSLAEGHPTSYYLQRPEVQIFVSVRSNSSWLECKIRLKWILRKQKSATLVFVGNSRLECQIREGNGNPLQYTCLENPMDGGAW